MKKNKLDWLVIGLALFSMFFGAGNLIFPPSIGLAMGENWLVSAMGFAFTGIGLPVLGVLTMNKVGSFENFAGKVSKSFFTMYSLLLMASVVFTNTPRTAATAYELGLLPNLGSFHISPIIISIIFFAVTLYMSLNPSRAIDQVGKFLTPTIVIIVLSMIVLGITNKVAAPGASHVQVNSFGFGFSQGYQTMDGIMAGLFSMVILANLTARGYTSKNERASLIKRASIVTGTGLSIIYLGLFYLGATGNQYFPADISRPELVSNFVNIFLGQYGNLIFGICVIAACLSTAVALTMVVSEFFSKTYNMDYKKVAVVSCVLSAFMANFGVDKIVVIASPILGILYPITIVLIFLGILGINSIAIRRSCVGVSGILAVLQIVVDNTQIGAIESLYRAIPLSSQGFVWVVPTVAAGLLTYILMKDTRELVRA
ncbi:branched-chain amino acid transport system II carrier protein [Fusobacteria bacterium ZRK30]|nr:branched-chain amino acid transport system II carrier protein [Fusobacteria bacterium ZRK30]